MSQQPSYKTTPQLLRKMAHSYGLKVDAVLAQWQPACGCPHPGTLPQCQDCPESAIFTQKIRELSIDECDS